MIWWDLPGPRAFVSAVLDDLRQGKSIFIHLPSHSPKRLSAVFSDVLRHDLRWFSTTVDACSSPINFLYELLVPESDPAALRTPQTLAFEPSFQTHSIWLEGLSIATWPVWSEFFTVYERASRSVHPARKTHFLVPLVGTSCHLEVPEGIGLGQHRWDGWIRYGDMLFYSCARVGERATPLETELTISLVAELAGWDPELCEWLARFSLQQLIRPVERLVEFASARGWNSDSKPLVKKVWSEGTCHRVKGKSIDHTCFLSPAELRRLVWRAEVSVLMPYVEEQRQDLLLRYARCLSVPFTTVSGECVKDVFELEIGHIEWQLTASAGIKRHEIEWVSVLKRARNSLSHLEPVDVDVLTSILRHADA